MLRRVSARIPALLVVCAVACARVPAAPDAKQAAARPEAPGRIHIDCPGWGPPYADTLVYVVDRREVWRGVLRACGDTGSPSPLPPPDSIASVEILKPSPANGVRWPTVVIGTKRRAEAGGPPASTRAPTGPCRGADSTSHEVLSSVWFLLDAQNPAVAASRDEVGLPALPASRAVLVSEPTTCQRAADAYRRHVAGPASRLSGRVYVVQVGTAYVVMDPTYYYLHPRERVSMTFDARWALRAKW